MSIEGLKNQVRRFFGNIKFITLVGEKEKVEFLTNILENDIYEDSVDELNLKAEKYFEELLKKQEQLIKEKDFEYLKNIAEILRNQKVRIEDGVYLESPVFKVTIDDSKDKHTFCFLTKEGADNFIKVNKKTVQNINLEKNIDFPKEERRQANIFNVEKNQNLELERLLEIIKRNF